MSPQEIMKKSKAARADKQVRYTLIDTTLDGLNYKFKSSKGVIKEWQAEWFDEQLEEGNAFENEDGTFSFNKVERELKWASE